MNYTYTAEQLRDLNEQVYRVNPNNPILNGKPSTVLKTGDIIPPIHGQKFYVVKSNYGKGSGFKGLAVAPVVNGKPDYSVTAVIAAGTDPDISQPDLWGAAQAIGGTSTQEPVAENFVKSVQNEPNVKITQLSGYSQGAYMLQVGAKFGIPTTVFNGWYDYGSLTEEEQQYMKNHSDEFINYRNKNDGVLAWFDGNKPGSGNWERNPSETFGTITWIDGPEGIAGHGLSKWKFDEAGNIVDNKTGQIVFTPAEAAELKKWDKNLPSVSSLRSRLSSGGLSGSQKIKVETELVLALAKQMKSEATRDKEAALKDLQHIQDQDIAYKAKYIQSINQLCGLVFEKEGGDAETVYQECAGSNAYNEETYSTIRKNITSFYAQKEKVANEMNKYVLTKIEEDRQLSSMFK